MGGEEQRGREAHRPGRRRERRLAQPRGPEDGKHEPEEEQRAGDVDGQVHRAVKGGIVAGDGPIDREGGEGDRPVGLGHVPGPAGQVVERPVELGVVPDVRRVVEDVRAREGARVGEQAGEDDGSRGQESVGSHFLAAVVREPSPRLNREVADSHSGEAGGRALGPPRRRLGHFPQEVGERTRLGCPAM